MGFEQIDWKIVLGCLLGVEQILANVKQLEANSTLQLLCNIVGGFVNCFKRTKKGAVKMSERVDKILEIRKKLRIFIAEAIKQGVLQESFVLFAAIGKMVAAGSADPAAIIQALDMLGEIDADLDKAAEAAKL